MTYEEHHAALVTYLQAKVEQADWHGVSDAANDLRVLEVAHERDAYYQPLLRNRPYDPAFAQPK